MKVKIIILILVVFGFAILTFLLTKLDKSSLQIPGQGQQTIVPSVEPTNSLPTNNKPTNGAVNMSPIVNNLKDCLARANNSEAHQGIIDEAIRDCYEKYR